MTENEQSQIVKYGDIIYIEFTHQNTRNLLSCKSFNQEGKYFVESKQLKIHSNSIYLKDFEDNLFMIFPKMKEGFTKKKAILSNGIQSIKERMKSTKLVIQEEKCKNEITKIINAFKEAKDDAYSQNEEIPEDIGQPIYFEDEFILIHFKSQLFVKRNEFENYDKEKEQNNALVLTKNYCDECVFIFAPWSSLDFNASYVFSNQNLLLCKKEKNLWSKRQFLVFEPENDLPNNPLFKKTTRKSILKKNFGRQKFILDFTDGQSLNNAFQIKVCSNYINPSSSNLSFATPVWLVCQNIDKYLNIKPTYINKTQENFSDDEESESENGQINNISNKNKNKMETIKEEKNNEDLYSLKESVNSEKNNNNEKNKEISNSISISNNDTNTIHLIDNNSINPNPNLIPQNSVAKVPGVSVNNDENKKAKSVSHMANNNSIKNNKGSLREMVKYLSKIQYKISFISPNKEKAINNINGLFYIEQCDQMVDIQSLTDTYLKNKLQSNMDLKIPPYVEYHKIIRFRHITTKKYLGVEEQKPIRNINNVNNPSANNNNNQKNDSNNNNIFSQENPQSINSIGKIILVDTPNDDCNWMFLESYKVINTDNYIDNKKFGIQESNEDDEESNSKEDNEDENNNNNNKDDKNNDSKKEQEEENKKEKNKIYKIKNKEILRIFHIKTKKFLCFDEVNAKVANNSFEISENLNEENAIIINNLSLTQTPFDSDLVRLLPSDIEQSWEISLILFLFKVLSSNLTFLYNQDYKRILGTEIFEKDNPIDKILFMPKKNNNNYERRKSCSPYILPSNSILDELKIINDKTKIIIQTFQDLRDYCLNNFSRKYDITISPGKPIFYRQQFLFDQGFLKKAFIFLEKSKKIFSIYSNYFNKFPIGIKEPKGSKEKKLTPKVKRRKSAEIRQLKKEPEEELNKENLVNEIVQNMKDCVKACFEFISSMCKNNPRTKKVVFKKRQILLDYFFDSEEAAKCFIDIIKEKDNIIKLTNKKENDNKKKGSEAEGAEKYIIENVLEHLNNSDEYDVKYLEILSKFMKIRDFGITSNQEHIFHEIFENSQDRFLIKIKPVSQDIQFLLVYKDKSQNYVEKNLVDFCNSQYLYEEGLIKYFAEELNLFANLCYGRNYVCLEKIRQIFPLDHLIYHISKIELNQEVLGGLINILNFVYIDIEPHKMTIYPSMVKRVTENLEVEKANKEKNITYLPLDKLNLILCLSLFNLNNIKYGKVILNNANINLIYNLIKFRLYENMTYSPLDIKEVINDNLDRRLHNLKDEVKKNIISGEELLIKNEEKFGNKNLNDNQTQDRNSTLIQEGVDEILSDKTLIQDDDDEEPGFKNDKQLLNSFYYKCGNRYIEINFDKPAGEQYLLFVMDRINEFLSNNLILNNIDKNTENKNIISQNFKTITNNDILTQSNINYLIESLVEIKNILTKGNESNDQLYVFILKQIEKLINYILEIKQEDMSNYLLHNILIENYKIIQNTYCSNEQLFNNEKDFFNEVKKKFYELPNIRDILMEDEYNNYQLFNQINYNNNIQRFEGAVNYNNTLSNLLRNRTENEDKKKNERLLNNSLYSDDSEYSRLTTTNYSNYNGNVNINGNINGNANGNGYGYDINNNNLFQYDSEYYYNLNLRYQELNLDNFFMNAVVFKNLEVLIVRILEMNVDGKMTKILLRLYTRLSTQREKLFSSLKNMLLLYKSDDLSKYYECNDSINELSFLIEKTEKWMVKERAPPNLRRIRGIRFDEVDDIPDEQKDFYYVYFTIYKYYSMIHDQNSNTYVSDKEVKLMQTIFRSFQIEGILMALLREITQEYQDGVNLNIVRIGDGPNCEPGPFSQNRLNEKQRKKITDQNYYFKEALEQLIKIIFKFFVALVHHTAPDLNQNVIDIVEFSKEYDYLMNLGLYKLIVELSDNQLYVQSKIKDLLDILRIHMQKDIFAKINEHFYDYETLPLSEFTYDYYRVEKMTQENYIKLLKKAILGMKLMENIIPNIFEDKYINIIIMKYLDILQEFNLFNIVITPSITLNYTNTLSIAPLKTNSKKPTFKRVGTFFKEGDNINLYSKTYYYLLQFIYYLLKITYRLLTKNQQIKDLIISLFDKRTFKQYIIDLQNPFDRTKLKSIVDNREYRVSKLFFKLQFYYKVKLIGFQIISIFEKPSSIGSKYLMKYLDKYYSVLEYDLNNALYFNDLLSYYGQLDDFKKYNVIYEMYRKDMYKYFFFGILPIVYNFLPFCREEFFPNIDECLRARQKYRKINNNLAEIYNAFLNEKNVLFFQALYIQIQSRRKIYKHMFDSIGTKQNFGDLQKSTCQYIDNLKSSFMNRQNTLNVYNNNYTNYPNYPNYTNYNNYNNYPSGNIFGQSNVLLEYNINFVNDLINDIENNEIIGQTIEKEKKIYARHLKSKINFHYLIIKENEIKNNTEESNENIRQETDIHLVNIFLKFIQEHYQKRKYFHEIKTIIDIMTYIVSTTPEILKKDFKGQKNSNFFFQSKVEEFKQEFTVFCQELSLSNGAIEIFLRMACQYWDYSDESIFPSIIKYFITILEGGNSEVQKKFTQLFQSLSNCDVFFYNMYKLLMDQDIFVNLKDRISEEEPKNDNQNLEVVTDVLRFLQLLTENHNLVQQNFLREQKTNRLSYNFINIIIEYLSKLMGKLNNINDNQGLTEYMTNLYLERILSILNTICEFLQGPCKKNQENLINTKVIELFMVILDETPFSCEEEENNNIQNEEENLIENNLYNNDDESLRLNTSVFKPTNTFTESESNNNIFSYNKSQKIGRQENKLFYHLSEYQKSLLLFKISLVLLSIIEGRKTKDNVIRKILRDLNYKLVIQKYSEIYLQIQNDLNFFLFTEENCKDVPDYEKKLVAESGFNFFFLLESLILLEDEETEFKRYSMLLMKNPKTLEKIEKDYLEEISIFPVNVIQEATQFYYNNSLSIEIVKDNIVFKVYCPKLQFFKDFDEEMEKNMHDEAKRESTQTKLLSLLDMREQTYMTLKQIYNMKKKFNRGPLKIFFLYPEKVQLMVLILIIIMNILIFIGYNMEGNNDKYHVEFFGLKDTLCKVILKVLGIIIICFSALIFIEFITKDAVIIYKRLYREYLSESYGKNVSHIRELEIYRVRKFLKTRGYKLFFNKLLIYSRLLLNFKVVYAFLYLIFAILGLCIHNFFFAFHLFEFIKTQTILFDVFKSIFLPLAQLIYIFVFFFILIYFYALIVYYKYYDLMPTNSCNSPLICMLAIYSSSFTSGGNLGNYFEEDSDDKNVEGKMDRYILDLSYTIIMFRIVWTMVSGLITDTFGLLRTDNEEKENDMENKCFICGLDRDKIENYYVGKEGFERHQQDHNIKNYLFYMFYLEEKDPNEYSGLESYVKKEVDKDSVNWFPIGRALKKEEWEKKHKSNNYS